MPGIVKKKKKNWNSEKKKIKNTKLFITNLEKIHG